MSTRQKSYNEIAGQNVHRIESLTDGVFAVALTLLVLDIKVPDTKVLSEGDLVKTFCDLTKPMLSYFMSFMTLGIFWTGQSLQYTFIHRSDRNLNWISLFFLMVVCLVPFTTAFLSKHMDFRFPLGLYWFNILLLGIIVFIQWNYAYKRNMVNLPDDEKDVVNKAIRRRVIIAQLLYGFGALLCFINTYLSIVFIIAVQLNYALAIFSKRIQANN